ncbi:MAG: hypothetical protein KGZ50_07185 [Peptococcaceae bacterium]|nr:hypothetical protein [Peptococcaceae bacterium]
MFSPAVMWYDADKRYFMARAWISRPKSFWSWLPGARWIIGIWPVFGERFRSERIESDAYLSGALRYIHRNPVKASITQDVAGYEWSSYGEFFNDVRYINEEQKAVVLDLFAINIRSLAQFHAQEDDNDYLETREDIEKYKRDSTAITPALPQQIIR